MFLFLFLPYVLYLLWTVVSAQCSLGGARCTFAFVILEARAMHALDCNCDFSRLGSSRPEFYTRCLPLMVLITEQVHPLSLDSANQRKVIVRRSGKHALKSWTSALVLPWHGAKGLFRELNPGPLAPEARIIPLDQTACGRVG